MPRLENAPPLRFSQDTEMGADSLRLVDGTDDDMKRINKLALKELTRDEVAIFRLDLVNTAVDRHYSRFPEKELQTINSMIVKKPLMEKHATRTELPIGRFFNSRIEANARGVMSVRPDAYMLKIPQNRERIDNIMGGVYWGTSIGFQFDYPECSICNDDLMKCSHMPGYEYEVERNGKKTRETCHYIMHEVSDVYEGSIVAVPSQRTEVVEARALPPDVSPNLMDAITQRRSLFTAPIQINTREPAPEVEITKEQDIAAEVDELSKTFRKFEKKHEFKW